MHFISFWTIFTRFAFNIFRERNRELKHAGKVVGELERQFEGTFDDATRKKIIKSHSVYNPLVIDAFCSLHSRTSSAHERKKLVYYFTCSSLLDNFFDRGELTNEQIDKICFETPGYTPQTFDEKAFIHCHSFLLDNVAERTAYLEVLRQEVAAQKASMQQFREDIDDDTIESIMKAKGGNAVLLCRYYLDQPANEAEDRCWFQLGVLIQLNNDLYDIYKDINDGIQTLATRCTDAFTMEVYVKQQIDLMIKMIAELPNPKKRKQHFLFSVAGVCGLARVAVDQLKRLQVNKERLPAFNTLPRKQLIVDMEKPVNILRWVKYVHQYGKT